MCWPWAFSIPLSGWAGSRFGGKRVYIFSLLLFLGGSILSSLSWNIESLIVFRVVQGLPPGLMITILQTILVQISGGKHLGQLISYISIPAVLGPILGPVLGGVIVNSLSWRWIFYVNIPVTLIAILLAWKGLPADQKIRAQGFPRLDRHTLALACVVDHSLRHCPDKFQRRDREQRGTCTVVDRCGVDGRVRDLRFKDERLPILDLRLFKSKIFQLLAACFSFTGSYQPESS